MNARLSNSADNKFMHKLTQVVLAGFALSLPLHQHINTWFLVALVLICAYQSWVCRLGEFLKKNWVLLAVPALLLIIRIFGIPYAIDVSTGIKETTRALSFLFLPFSFLVLAKTLPQKTIKTFFSWLTIGCLLAVVICWTSVLKIIIENGEPFTNLFTWKKSNTYLTAIIDIHPPYLGALVLTALLYVFKQYIHNKAWSVTKRWATVLVFVFVLFLFHLVVRNSLLFLILLAAGYALYFRKWKALALGAFFVAGVSFTIITNGNHYLKRKYYKMLDFSNENIGDKRFERLEASWNIFLQHPILGAGSGYDDKARLENYKQMGDEVAFTKKLNAHNQYMEFLSTYGIIGFLLFIGILFFLLKKGLVHQQYFLGILLCLFMFACITESFLERELGIKYLSFIAGLIAFKTCSTTIRKL